MQATAGNLWAAEVWEQAHPLRGKAQYVLHSHSNILLHYPLPPPPKKKPPQAQRKLRVAFVHLF